MPAYPTPAEATIKELLTAEAAEAGLTFVPRIGRFIGGLQVHALGKLSVIIDVQHNAIKAFVGDRWAPVAMEDAIRLARDK